MTDNNAEYQTSRATAENKSADATASALAGGLTLLTAGLGLFGGLSGAIARMARNHELATAIAVGLVLGSVVLALASRLVNAQSRLFSGRGPSTYLTLLWLALAAFVCGLALAMFQLNSTLGEDDRPSVAATTSRDSSGALMVGGTASAGGLESTDRIYVSLVAQNEGAQKSEQIYYALVGPNQEGIVDHKFSVVLESAAESVVVTVGKVTRANAISNRQTNLHPVCVPPLPRNPSTNSQAPATAVRP